MFEKRSVQLTLISCGWQLVRKKLITTAEEQMQQDVTMGEVYGNLQNAFQQMEKLPSNLTQSTVVSACGA
jgi:hypothetical protein